MLNAFKIDRWNNFKLGTVELFGNTVLFDFAVKRGARNFKLKGSAF